MITADLRGIDSKGVLFVVLGAAALVWYIDYRQKQTIEAVKETAKDVTEYVASGQMGESAFTATHDENGNPNAVGKVLDWFAGIEKGRDY